jgi:hypothetical protein
LFQNVVDKIPGFQYIPHQYLGYRIKLTPEEALARKKYLEDYKVKIQQLKRV